MTVSGGKALSGQRCRTFLLGLPAVLLIMYCSHAAVAPFMPLGPLRFTLNYLIVAIFVVANALVVAAWLRALTKGSRGTEKELLKFPLMAVGGFVAIVILICLLFAIGMTLGFI